MKIPDHPLRPAALGLAALAAGLGSACFVDSGDCVSQGVVIEPCATPMKVGQTRVFTARVTGNPDDDVNWVQTAALDAGFDPVVGAKDIELVGTLGLPGVYQLRAESASDPDLFGEAIITVLGNNPSYPPPPVQLNGVDFPDDYRTAVAAGGNRYYVAYADPEVFAARGQPDNFFVKQFDLATNRELRTITGQFTFFGSGGGGPAPNVAADCQGNGYWLDQVDQTSPIVLRRLSAGGAFAEQPLTGFQPLGLFAVACDGSIYLSGIDSRVGNPGLFRSPAFGSPLVPLVIQGLSEDPLLVFERMIVDSEGRILLADVDPDFCSKFGSDTPQIVRVLLDANGMGTVDMDFTAESCFEGSSGEECIPFGGGVRDIAVDAGGVIYVAPIFIDFVTERGCSSVPSTTILALNSDGRVVYSVDEYLNQCPDGCTASDCGMLVPFQAIQDVSVSSDGRLQVVDDVTLGDVDPACQETVRVILIDK